MIDARKVIDEIVGNDDYIEKVLYELGYENIKKSNNCYRFSNFGSNERNVSLWIDDLRYINFSRGLKGNIFTLVMDTKGCNFPDALKWITKLLGIQAQKKPTKLPYGGFYKHIIKSETEDSIEMTSYSLCDLPKRGGLSEMFFRDGVSYQVQYEYGVSVDLETNKIIIPIEGHDASLIGAKWRANDKNATQRYGMLLSYPKSQVLFGFNKNYDTIQRKNAVMLVEAEKGVMQGATFGVRNLLACGGHQLSKEQIRLIQTLRVGTIIVGFDESIEDEELEWQCKKLKSVFNTRIGFIYDKNNDVLKKNSKDSPVDHGKRTLKELLRNHIIWV